jgi:hypothetical protein
MFWWTVFKVSAWLVDRALFLSRYARIRLSKRLDLMEEIVRE